MKNKVALGVSLSWLSQRPRIVSVTVPTNRSRHGFPYKTSSSSHPWPRQRRAGVRPTSLRVVLSAGEARELHSVEVPLRVRVEVPAGMTYAVSATAIQTTTERQRSVGEM